MSDKRRPTAGEIQCVARVLVTEKEWRSKVEEWFPTIYFILDDGVYQSVKWWRKSYSIGCPVGKYQPRHRRVKTPRLFSGRFDKWSGDLRSAQMALIKKEH